MRRDVYLRGLSSDHHHALVLARRLSRADLGWSPSDSAALQTRFEQELEPHFMIEEEVLLPALRDVGRADLVERTLADHATIRAAVVSACTGDARAARELGAQLADHVRFEEREVFPACEILLPNAVLEEALRRTGGTGSKANE